MGGRDKRKFLHILDLIAFILLYLALLNLFSFTLVEGLILAVLVLLFSVLVWSLSVSNESPINLKNFYAMVLIIILLFMGIIPIFMDLSPHSSTSPNKDSPQDWLTDDMRYPPPTEFQLLLGTVAGSRIMESYAFFVKIALAQLGVDATLQAIPYSMLFNQDQQFQPFDLLLFQWPKPTNLVPELSWKYHSTSSHLIHNRDIIDLSDNVTTFMNADTGVNVTQVDDLLERIDGQTDPQERLGLLDEFTELYMDKLLYELPLLSIDQYWAVTRGYGDDNDLSSCLGGVVDDKNWCNNDRYDEEEGMFRSRALGASWNPLTTPTSRSEYADLSTLQLRSLSIPSPDFFNPYRYWDEATTQHLEPLIEGLLNIDKDLHLHPGIAYNYLEEDWIRPQDDVVVKDGKISLFLNNEHEWQFPSTHDYTGTNIPSHPVDANDVATTLTLLTKYTSSLSLLDPLNFVHLDHWTINSTVFDNDTISLYYSQRSTNDIYNLAELVPLPHHLLAGQLHLENGTTYPFGSGMDPLQSEEWQFFSTLEGMALVGPYDISSHEYNEYYEYSARDDYPYPNEWDTTEMYNTYRDDFSSYDDLYNLSYFAPHVNNEPTPAYYWVYEDNSSTQYHEKPTTQNINTILLKTVDDDNAAVIMFEVGALDSHLTSSLGSYALESEQKNRDCVVRESKIRGPPVSLVFNLQNDKLQKIDIRYAIASALDKNEMSQINDGYSFVEDSPVSSYYNHLRPSSFYGDDGIANTDDDLYWSTDAYAIPYDYQTARDLIHYDPYSPMVLHTGWLSSKSPVLAIYSPYQSNSSSFIGLKEERGK